MEFHPQDIVIHLINIGVLYLLLRVLLYKPVQKFLDTREERIRTQLQEAQQAEARAQQQEQELLDARLKAEEEIRELMSSGTRHARLNSDTIIADARFKADAILAEARERELEESRRIKRQTHNDVVAAAVELAKRMIGREISAEDNRALAEAFFLELQKKEETQP